MNFILQLFISAISVIVASYILPGVHADSFLTALLVAAVLSFLNSVVKPIMIILTIPVTLISFGLFLIVINAFIILLADKLIDGFEVRNFWWAVLFSLFLSFITSIFNSVQQKQDKEND